MPCLLLSTRVPSVDLNLLYSQASVLLLYLLVPVVYEVGSTMLVQVDTVPMSVDIGSEESVDENALQAIDI